MKRWLSTLIGLAVCSAMACAQQSPGVAPPFSSDLVLWSYMQQPQQPEQEQDHQRQQPTPDPNPETQPSPSQPGTHPASPASAESQGQSPTAQIFTGTINKDADSYVLKVSETTAYKLDNQQEVQQYEGKRVRVTGTLDSSINLIHVDNVEPLS